ncbi:hypothetical protein MSP8886_02207 [Marinomonas spartinae]|uniref:Lipoprotein n=1 Tax=Marinomonas spartinae TaxID=1792290 RepID=A0A1A8THV6_9GAMM|nr:hypothetical protein [Marinomonas spartinae]SBS31695.1 hypothetical protein MSP8886_02207 [Marinomonas spartinae]
MFNRESIIKLLTLVLISLISCLSLSACSSLSANDDTKKPKKFRVQTEWGKYSFYNAQSQYLQNYGFAKKSICAISLMNSFSLNIDNIKGYVLEKNKREKKFEEVVNEGVNILKKSPLHSEVSNNKLHEFVYQNLLQNELLLSYISMTNKRAKENSENSNRSNFLIKIDDYKKFYEIYHCSSVLNYNIE